MDTKKLTKDELKIAIQTLSDSGVDFVVGDIEGGSLNLNTNQVADYIENREQFFADLHGVGIENVNQE